MKIDAPLLAENPLDAGRLACDLEARGFDGAYTFDGRTDPFLPLAFAAEHTEQLALMTAIAVAFARNPMTVAQLANDLQRISRGRFILGLGSQIKAHVEKRFSMPWSAPAARMREFILALRAIWHAWQTQTPLDFRGTFYTHTLMPPLMAPPPNPYGTPRVFLAGVGPVMTEVAGEVADGYLLHPFHSRPYLDTLALPALRRGLSKSGRSEDALEISCQLLVAVGRNSEEMARAKTAMQQQIAFYASTPAYRSVLESLGRGDLQDELTAMSKAGRWADMGQRIDDDLLHAVAIVDTPTAAAHTILDRYRGWAHRISPLGYIADPALSNALMTALREAMR